MALIDFTNVTQHGVITPSTTSAAYHSTWGYYTLEQSVEFEYSPAGLYQTKGVFTIHGTFVPPSGSADEAGFNAVKAKYNSLNSTFRGKLSSSAPADLSDYGTASDGRTVALPITDDGGSTIYAIPNSLEIEESQWPFYLRYSASFNEAVAPTKKIKVNSYCVDDGVVTITTETPRLTSLAYSFANAEELYYTGWNPRAFSLSGTIPEIMPSGSLGSTSYRTLANDLMDGMVTIKTIDSGGSEVSVYSNLYIDQSSISINKSKTSEGISISFSARY